MSIGEVAKELGKRATPGVRHRVITDVDDGGHRLVEIFQDSKDTVLDCNMLGSKVIIETVLKVIPEDMASMQGFEDLTNMSIREVAKELAKRATPGVRHEVITDVADNGHILVEIFQDSNDTVLDCNILGSKVIIETVLKVIPEDMVTRVSKDEMQYYLDLCDEHYKAVGSSD
ncbi:hypothetical protein ISCGN_005340 [Ixodes scapularis]